jgi:hypothetical protein
MIKSLLLILITLSGCVNTAYYHAEVMPNFTYQSSKRLYVFLPKDPIAEEQKLLAYLQQAVKKKGYHQVSTYPFDYAMFFKFYDDSNISTFSMPITMSMASFSNGNTAMSYYLQSIKSYKSAYIPLTDGGKSINIQVQLYSSTKNFSGKYDLLWYGHTSVNEDQYHKNPQAIVDVLISLLGNEFKEDLPANLAAKK